MLLVWQGTKQKTPLQINYIIDSFSFVRQCHVHGWRL